jgi:GGDEF domain-containing protein
VGDEDHRRAELARQLVEDAEQRLRSLLRDGDVVARFGDDALVARVSVADRQGLERVCERITAELAEIRTPRRTREFRPVVSSAFGEEIDANPRFAALDRELGSGRTAVLRAAG